MSHKEFKFSDPVLINAIVIIITIIIAMFRKYFLDIE